MVFSRKHWWLTALWLCALLSLALGCGGSDYYSAATASYDAKSGEDYGGGPPPPPAPMEPMAAPAPGGGGDYDFEADSSAGEVLSAYGNMGYADRAEPPAQSAPTKRPSAGAPVSAPKPSGTPAKDMAVASGEPMLIYTGDVTLAVFEVKKGLDRVEGIAKELGGYLARRDDTSITVRVPVARFQEAVRLVEEVGDVIHRNVVSEDVTEEFRDLQIQLSNLRAVRDRLAKLLDQAKSVEEALKVERELGRVAGEIDRLEGRMKFLSDRAAMSTLTVVFEPRPSDVVGKKSVELPIPWLHQLGLGRLMSL